MVGDLPGDRQAEPGASGVLGPGGGKPGEALENHLTLVGWDPRAIIVHRQYGVIVFAAQGDADGGDGMAFGVVQKVGEHPVELSTVATDEGRPTVGDEGLALEAAREFAHDELVQVDGYHRRARVSVKAAKLHQIGNDDVQSFDAA